VAPVKVFAPPIVWAVVRSTKFCVDEPVPPLAIATMPVTFEAVPVTDPEIGLVTVRSVRVPTLVKLLVTTVGFNVVPVRVPASAVTVILDVPSKDTPLIVLAFSSAVAVAALPVISPVTFPVNGPVKLPAVTPPVTASEPRVPTEVSDEFTTVAFKVLPVKVPAAAVTVMGALPSNRIPFIVLPGSSAVAVAALPVIFV
jgi:hypothetical protein